MRNIKFDNMKFLLIVFVVLGHMCGNFFNTVDFAKSLYLFIYSFHMPALIFISGFFIKKGIKDRNMNYLGKYIIIYFMIIIVNKLSEFLLGNFNGSVSLFSENGIQWFMMSLFFYFIFTILLSRYNKYAVLIILLCVGSLAGFDKGLGDNFSSARTITFYIYYYLGYSFSDIKLNQISDKLYMKILAGFNFILLFAVLFSKWGVDNFGVLAGFLGGGSVYSANHMIIWRLISYIVGIVLILSLYILMPNRNLIISKFGQRTLNVYIFHLCLLSIYNKFIFSRFTNNLSLFIVSVFVSILIAIILSSKSIDKVMNKIVSINKSTV